jgi:hypothetical protein
MTVGDVGSAGGAIVALVALIISLISMRKTNKFGETTDRLNRLLIERETADGVVAKKADLSANLIRTGKNDHRLKVFNRGRGVARNVRLLDLNAGESILISSDISRKFPVPILEQHQSVEVIASMHLKSSPRVHIKLQWDDESGSDHEKELTPTL